MYLRAYPNSYIIIIMKRLRVFVLAAILMAAFCLIPIHNTYADDPCSVAGYSDPLVCGTPNSDEELAVINKVRQVLNVVYLWIGIIAVIFIVVGGFLFMTSRGDPSKVQRGKSTVLYSICGLIVTLSAFAITSFTIGALEGRTNGSVAREGDSGDPYSSENRSKVRAIRAIDHTSVIAGQKITIKATVVPDYAKNKKITYKSSDPSTASIDNKGNLKARKEGEVTITITSEDGPKKEVKVSVLKPIPVTIIKVDKSEVKLKKGKTAVVKATALPLNASDKTLSWASADTKVATVTQNGKIKAIDSGKSTTVTVTARNMQVFAFNESPNTITLADAEATKELPKVQAKIKVTVENEFYACQGPTSDKKFSGNREIRQVTKQFITPHQKDFKWDTYDSYIRSKGGYTAYVKSLGGIFTIFAGKEKKIKVKTACDFQAAAEYTFGLFSIWGVDYDNGTTYHRWGDETNDQSDAFYSGSGNRYVDAGWGSMDIDTNLGGSKYSGKRRTNCNYSCDALAQKTDLYAPQHFCSTFDGQVGMSKVGKIYDTSKLQVGDLLHFFRDDDWKHVAVVGEVYKDYIITYDGGGRFISSKIYKYKIPRGGSMINGTTYSGYDYWYGTRVWNIDQSKTLEGLQ